MGLSGSGIPGLKVVIGCKRSTPRFRAFRVQGSGFREGYQTTRATTRLIGLNAPRWILAVVTEKFVK